MKKRITALLLCLVMVFSLIPTTVWAAGNSTVVLHPSVNNTVTGVKVKVGDKIDGYAIKSISGYDITVDLGKYNVNNDTFRLPYAKDIWEGVDNNKVDYISWAGSGSTKRNEGGNALLANGKNTAYYYFKGAPVLLTFTLNYDANGGTGAPASQTYKATSQYEKSYTFTISSQTPTREDYNFLGWNTDKNAATASKQPSNTIVVTGTTTLYAVWEQKQHEHKDNDGDGFCDKDNTCMHPKDDNGYCTVDGCTHPDGCCPKPSSQPDPNPPVNPGKPDFKEDLAGKIKVKCIVDPANHTLAECMYSLGDGQYTDNGMNNATDVPTYSITLNNASFIEKFDTATDYQHTDKTGGNVVITWRWDAENENWKLISGTPTIKCECVKEIEPPTDGPTDTDVKAALDNLTVTVKCINPGTKHTSCAYGVLGGNDGYQLTKNEDGTYNVVLNAAPFVAAYSKSGQGRGLPHDLYSAKNLTWVLTYDKESGKWVGKPKEAGVDDIIQTAHRVPVHVVIYRNGDTSQAYADIALNSELPGTVIDLTKLKIGDYYQGDVEFYGWYNDGKWNEYTKDLANPPAGLERITVNGWTNLKCMVYDLDKVVYFQSAEDLAAYQKDHSKNDGLLYTTTVRRGTTLPTADAPAATREGYTFQYWSREGQYQDVTGQTVSGWTNLYAAWTPNTDTPYKVEHYQEKLDGTYVKADTDELTGTTDTRATAEAKSYTGFTVDKTVEGTVESGIIAGDGSLVLKLYYTRNSYIISSDLRINGGDANLADGKTYAWTHRYGGKFEETIDYQPMLDALKARAMKVDAANEPYDAEIKLCFPKSEELFNEKILTYGQDGAFWNPGVKNTAYIWGYATTSYEVIFKAGDGSKVDTQIVKYGELATEPTTELKGYDFLGWFDADGNPFDFNNTEITHKTTLTAKWEKKTYIIASDLRINGGDANLADGKTYPWSYRYGGKFEETIDYTEMFDALKTRAMKVDEANGPVDSVVTLCFPGDYPATAKKLFNDTILTYGQDGGGWNPGNKNTAPIWGFATNVYAVTFNYKDDKTATATQNVEYGNMATEPQKVDRPGYRFLGWFTEDGKAFDFSTPITKSMTLTAKWEIVNINAYIIPITSDGTQLVGAGFDMALNTTTLSRVGLPGYEDEDAVRIHFATFASSAGLADAEDYFPGTDPLVVKAVADLKNGLERRFAAGVNEAKADGIMSKTNWTYLHVGELDDEEDTNFLSGNLVFYSARFVTEDSEHVTGMPNAEYTHNAVAVYDYYLDGETITIPDAVLVRSHLYRNHRFLEGQFIFAGGEAPAQKQS